MVVNSDVLKNRIARKIAMGLSDGNYVNLGIGLPTLIANHIPNNIDVFFQSENGMICMGKPPVPGNENHDVIDAGANYADVLPTGSFFDSTRSFGMIRGGHIDVCVLGALQVDAKGNLANWIIPGKLVPGMGGAMDLVTGAKQVIVATLHTNNQRHKILEECTLPLTAVGKVNKIVTEFAVMEVTDEGIKVLECHESITLNELQDITGAKLLIGNDVKIWRDME